jgi:hypothetical protein
MFCPARFKGSIHRTVPLFMNIVLVAEILIFGRETRARILKHLLEAEKSTFRKELSFQRSESTTGFVQALVFIC